MPEASINWTVLAMMVIAGLAGGIGDVTIYLWAKSDRPVWMLVASCCWLVALIAFGLALRHASQSLAAAFLIVTMLHVSAVFVIDLAVFGERLSTLEWIGALLAVFAVVALEVGHASRVRQAGSEVHEAANAAQRSPEDAGEPR